MSAFGVLIRRELALNLGRGGGPLLALVFYAAVATLLPLAIGSEPGRLAAVAPGTAWLALALASLLSLERLFERDFEDGALDLLALDLFGEARGDRGNPGRDALLRNIVEGDVDSGEGADLSDPGAHLSRPDHPDFIDAHFICP